ESFCPLQNCFSYTQCIHILPHIVNTKYVSAPRAQKRSQREAGYEAIADLLRSDQLAEEGFAGNSNHQGSIMYAQLLQVREQFEVVFERFPETNARIKRNRHRINV